MNRTWNLELGTWNLRRSRRRGIVLLMVVSLLALFILLGATFTLVALHALNASKLELKQEQTGDAPDTELDFVLGQLLYDTQARTVLQYHSLLRDLYGYDANIVSNGIKGYGPPPNSVPDPNVVPQFRETVLGAVTSAPTGSGGNQLYSFNFALPLTASPATNPYLSYFTSNNITPVPLPYAALSPIPNYYAGRVVTFQTGPAANHSARIVAYTPVNPYPIVSNSPQIQASGTLTIEAIESKLAGSIFPSAGDTFVINGAPFNGTGAGYYYNAANGGDTSNFGLNASFLQPDPFSTGITAVSASLLPNFAGYEANGAFNAMGVLGFVPDLGGLDETWDAPDFQNMYLAMVPPRAAESYNDTDPTNNIPIIPSFHRPELVNFWLNSGNAPPALSPLNSDPLPNGGLSNPFRSLGFIDPGPQGAQRQLAATQYRDFVRKFILRPMPWDHPNFTGSNPYLTPIYDVPTNNLGSPITNMTQLWRALAGLDPGGSGNHFPGWDVDNDNDGVPDSIWIDPGLPVVTSPDGRRYKRLAAILVKDLDGSININAAGNLAQVADFRYRAEYVPQAGMLPAAGFTTTYTAPASASAYANVLGLTPNLFSVNTNLGLGYANAYYAIPRGMGFGPAEIDFLKIFTTTTTSPAYSDTVALQAYSSLLRTRYTSNLGGTDASAATALPGPPLSAVANAGADARDPLSAIKHAGIPNDYAKTAFGGGASVPLANWYAQPSWYASPPDVWGRGAVVLDVGGQPLMAYMGEGPQSTPGYASNGEVADCPYELRLSGEQSGADTPYTAAELERLLRYHDSDASQLSPRILNATVVGSGALATSPLAAGYPTYAQPGSEPPGVIGVTHHRRQMFTPISSDIPTPATTIAPEMRAYVGGWSGSYYIPQLKIPGQTSILDLYYSRLAPNFTGTLAPQLQYEMLKIVPWEFFKGQKFDINRQFGDGLDSNGDGVRDDPYESVGGEYAWYGGNANVLPNLPATFQNVYSQPTNGIDLVNGGPPSSTFQTDNMHARQLYARHLFCLAMLMLPPDFFSNTPTNFPPTGNTSDASASNANVYKKLVIRRIAQWAINCVDYRDSDSVMTSFEFDYNPWDGWQVDGNLATDGTTQNPEQILVTSYVMGVPTTAIVPQTPGVSGQRGVVWGMEMPDLVMTESLAFHDRRVKDTMANKLRSDASAPDPTLDQFRVPQGSLFLELYCPRPYRWGTEQGNQKPLLPLELYDTNGNLQLGKLAPASSILIYDPVTRTSTAVSPPQQMQWPVWRVALSKIRNSDPNQVTWHPVNAIGDPANAGTAYPESASLDPFSPSLVPGAASPLVIDRYAYLGNATNLPGSERPKAFYTTTSPTLAPGQYAVVGPRDVTYLGSQDYTTTTATQQLATGTMWGGNSWQQIQISPGGGVVLYDTTPQPPGNKISRTASVDMRANVGIVCSFPANTITPNDATTVLNDDTTNTYFSTAATWTTTCPWPIGLNVTEPLPLGTSRTPADNSTYYTQPDPTHNRPSTSQGYQYADFYDDPDLGLNGATNFLNNPLDSPSTPGSQSGAGRPLAVNSMTQTGTYQNCSCAYLQRLANPTLAYNPAPYDEFGNATPDARFYNPNLPINPYITIDWQSIDVHVFNGEDTRISTNAMITGDYDPDDANASNYPVNMRFRTRQRGYVAYNGTNYQPTSNPWPPSTKYSWSSNFSFEQLPTTNFLTSNASIAGPYFPINLSDLEITAPNYVYDTIGSPSDRHTLGYINSTVDYPHSTTITPGTPYVGEPYNNPFPWINWNNRPFTNAMELLAVPCSSASRFFLEMTPGFPPPITPPTAPTAGSTPTVMPNPYYTPNNPLDPIGPVHLPFGQMLNFFQSTPSSAFNLAQPSYAPHLYRLLDYVEVPSPFLGTERWYNPQNFGGVNTGTNPPQFTSGTNTAALFYRPPFNKLSRFRDPGKVNVNTIFDTEIWDSVVGQFPGLRTVDNFASELFLSRQGQSNASGLLVPNATYPTWFANPIRTADSADLMPPVPPPTLGANTSMSRLNPIESTFLRPDPRTYLANNPLPLFQVNQLNNQYNNWVGNLPGSGTTNYVGQYHDITRNPYFTYQPYQKIGNVLTTRSNCFAVWITIGYFEVEENLMPNPAGQLVMTYDTAHPDGYRLAQEIGYDTGEVTRHRAFFIIDRSIPVGFIPGSRLNTDDCILVRRLIE